MSVLASNLSETSLEITFAVGIGSCSYISDAVSAFGASTNSEQRTAEVSDPQRVNVCRTRKTGMPLARQRLSIAPMRNEPQTCEHMGMQQYVRTTAKLPLTKRVAD